MENNTVKITGKIMETPEYLLSSPDRRKIYKSTMSLPQRECGLKQQVYKDNFGHDMPCYSWGKNAPWHVSLMNPLYREPVKSI